VYSTTDGLQSHNLNKKMVYLPGLLFVKTGFPETYVSNSWTLAQRYEPSKFLIREISWWMTGNRDSVERDLNAAENPIPQRGHFPLVPPMQTWRFSSLFPFFILSSELFRLFVTRSRLLSRTQGAPLGWKTRYGTAVWDHKRMSDSHILAHT